MCQNTEILSKLSLQEEINSFEWDAVFADEAHKIKVSHALRKGTYKEA